jgi:two-component system sensor histidine kinase VicK
MSLLAANQRVALEVIDQTHQADRTPQSGYTQGDPDRLSQVLDNLLDNAIRHSPENSTITITIRQANDGLECSVSDQGTGIPAGHLPFIFERFYRVDSSRGRNSGGTGLGLAIARALVNAQGGHITAHSIEGQGTTIRFWLPITSSP